MTDDAGAPTPEAPKTAKKPGRPSRAAIEAEMRERLEAEIREETEAKIRAEYEQREAEAAQVREAASEARPVSGTDLGDDPSAEGAVLIHFVEDGLTILGKVWFRGEELSLVPGTKNWEDSIVNLYKGSSEKICFALMDEFQQEKKWGRRFFRSGPWRGKRLDEIEDELLTDEQRAQLQKAQQIRDQKFGSVLA